MAKNDKKIKRKIDADDLLFIFLSFCFCGAPTRNRTWNLVIKSHLLCQLSYRRLFADKNRTTKSFLPFFFLSFLSYCEPGENRTLGQRIKSPLLYQLSYRLARKLNLFVFVIMERKQNHLLPFITTNNGRFGISDHLGNQVIQLIFGFI